MIAFLVGLVFGLVYEAFRIARLILRFKAAVFVCDVAFFVLSAFAVCALSKALGNYIRIYTVLGFGAGVFTYIVTIGRLLNLAESAASTAWRLTIGRALNSVARGIKYLFTKIWHGFKKIFGKIDEIIVKAAKNRPTRLQSSSEKMYNSNNKIRNSLAGNMSDGENMIGEKKNVIKANVRKSI